MPKNKKPTWADAYNKCRLNLETIEMAKKLGMSPRTVIANHASTRSEKWKAPVKEWIHDLYEKRFGKSPKPSSKNATPTKPTASRVDVVAQSKSSHAFVEDDDIDPEATDNDYTLDLHITWRRPNNTRTCDDLDDPFAE